MHPEGSAAGGGRRGDETAAAVPPSIPRAAEVDVVIVTHNSASLVGAALAGVARHRVIVIDNCSVDETVSVAQASGAEVIVSTANSGFGAAANLGIAASDTDYVLLLNPDAVISEPALSSLVGALDSDDGLAVVSPVITRPDGSRQRVSWPFPSAAGAWLGAVGLNRFDPRSQGEFLVGACLLIRRTAFDEVGGFDTRFWLYAEESDLFKRLRDVGWRTELVPSAAATHVGGASGDTTTGLVLDHFERGGEHFVRKHSGGQALLSYRLANIVGASVRAATRGRGPRGQLQRHRLRRGLRELVRHPTTVPLDSPAMGTPGEGVVVCSLEPWDEVWRRNQFLVRELLALDPNRRVLFVEPPFDWTLETRHRRGRLRQRGLRPLESDGRIIRYEPGKLWPRVLGPLADRSLRRQVRKAAQHLGFAAPVLWVNDPAYAGLSTDTGWASLYDITDDWSQAGGSTRARQRVIDNERKLFEECGSVVVCSEGLADTRRIHRPDLVVIPNAVDVDHLRAPQPRPIDLPDGPTAVYVGTLHADRLDVQLVVRLAQENPTLNVVLVGPDSLDGASREVLATMSNVHLLGARSYDVVPGYMQHADVCIVPHVVSPFTESLDPIKAYECLAVGRPTIATPVAGFRGLGAPIVISPTEDFPEAVKAALAPGVGSELIDVASWRRRAVAFEAVLDGLHVPSADDRSATSTKVCLFTSSFAPHKGGVEELVRQLAHAYADRDVPSTVVTMRWPKDLPAFESIESTPVFRYVFRVPEGGPKRVLAAVALNPIALVSLVRLLRRERCTVVHIQCVSHAAWFGLQASRMLRLPLVVTLHGELTMDATGVYERSRLLRHTLRAVLRRAEAITACSEFVLDEVEEWFGQSLGARARVIHNGVDLTEFDRGAPHDEGVPYILGIGRLVRQKGFDILIGAMAQLVEDPSRGHRLLLAGDGPERAALEDLVGELGLEDRVRFLGSTDRPTTVGLFKGADVFVCPSRQEPFGIVNLEAMAAGAPVVATHVGGIPEFVIDGERGVLVAPDDVSALHQGIAAVIDDPDARERIVRQAREYVEGRGWGAIADDHLATY